MPAVDRGMAGNGGKVHVVRVTKTGYVDKQGHRKDSADGSRSSPQETDHLAQACECGCGRQDLRFPIPAIGRVGSEL